MNDKIKELAEQAGVSFLMEDDHSMVMNAVDLEKFAELIVKECAEVADCNWRNQCPGLYVKEHFGVKE